MTRRSKTIKAILLTNAAEPVQLQEEVPITQLASADCLVRIKAAALNRRDQWIREGMYPGLKYGTILGSDACGVVEEGPDEWIGQEVIINPNVSWGPNPEVQSTSYSVLGMPTNGTLATCMAVSSDRLHKKPIHLNAEQAAAIPLAGLTAYRATFTKGQVSKDQKVLVTGAGGGVSQFAIAFSVAADADVYVTSGDNDKIDKAKELGAVDGFNYREEKWYKSASSIGGYDVIIDSAGGNEMNNYLKLIRPGGRIVIYGSTTGYPEKLDVFRLFWSQAQIIGSTMGNDQEFEDMIRFVEENNIIPTIDKVFDFEDYLSAFDRFKSPGHFGKIVLRMNEN